MTKNYLLATTQEALKKLITTLGDKFKKNQNRNFL